MTNITESFEGTTPEREEAWEMGTAQDTGRPISVLLADDHKILRQGLSSLLKDEPGIIVVGEVETAWEAIEATRAHRPEVVIMDVNMPGMNGIEATRIIVHENPDTKVIGLSMYADEDISAAILQAGAQIYLTKGCPASDLIDAIRACGDH